MSEDVPEDIQKIVKEWRDFENPKDNVVPLFPANAADDPDNVLAQAKGVYKELLLLGWDADGDLNVRATNALDVQSVLFMIEVFKMKLLSGSYSGDTNG